MDTKNPLEPPKDEYGPVRDRRDFDPLKVCMKPILPCPFREFSFTTRTGWRYYPFVPFVDRLGSSRGFKEVPSTVMAIPESWQDKGLSSSKMIDSGPFEDDKSRKRTQELHIAKTTNLMKRQRLGDATLVTDGTFTNNVLDPKKQSNITGTGNNAGATIVSESTSSTNSKGKSTEATRLVVPKAAICALDEKKRRKTQLSSNTTGTGQNAGATIVSESTSSTNSKGKPSEATRLVVPKAAICALYGQNRRKTQLSNKQYLTWDNGAKSHELKFTSVFVCPITNEVFLAGKYGDTYEQDGCLVWFKRKNLAEHAAAARAYDCFMLRERVDTAEQLGVDPPYEAGDQPIVPLNQIPPNIVETIQQAQKAANAYQGEKMLQQQQQATANSVPAFVRPRYSATPAQLREPQRSSQGSTQSGNPSQDFERNTPPPPPEEGRYHDQNGRRDNGQDQDGR